MISFDDEELKKTDRVREVQLPEWEEEGYPPSYEFILSRGGVRPEDNVTLSPWVRQFVGLSAESAKELLRLRWEKFLGGPCEKLAEYMLRFLPYSIATWSGQSWLVCRSERTKSIGSQIVIIPVPVTREYVAERMSSHRIANDVFAEIACFLCGLRETLPPQDGYFLQRKDVWETLDDEFVDGLQEPRWLKERWHMATVIFGSTSGEGLVRNREGSYDWVGAEMKISSFAKDDKEFIKALDIFHTRGAGLNGWPFDTYSSRDATYMHRNPGE